MNLLNKAYVNLSEISRDIGLDRKTLRKQLQEMNIRRYDIGYRSSEIIKKFNLKDWIELKMKIENKKAPSADQSKSAQ